MSNLTTNKILVAVSEAIDIPDSSYEIAGKRYRALSEWFSRPESRCSAHDPHLYGQGSFRLGTVIRPLNKDGEYDLDMGCRLRRGVSKATHTQKQLKELVGAEVAAYCIAQGFKQACEEKNRCWRLKYTDQLNFHLDAVPSIPAEPSRCVLLTEAMVKAGTHILLAQTVANMAGAITDKTLYNYTAISNDWLTSNSEGFALWFESRMELAKPLLEIWIAAARAAKIEKLPSYRRKSPLQKVVQILKRHRDAMFEDNPDGKPISIIITTLAAVAYGGEVELDDALAGILDRMGGLVRPNAPYVPNPVNPDEDFADKWGKSEYQHLRLAEKFRLWLEQAKIDLGKVHTTHSADGISKMLQSAFAVSLSEEVMSRIPELLAITITPKSHAVSARPVKPWDCD
ncbi:MAG: nucleotidyltransferase [Planctomycetota bacterium]